MPGEKKKRPIVHYLAIYGCVSTGMIYACIGVLAIRSFLGIGDGGADEASLLAVLNNSTIGTVAVWIILLGTVSYIVWRIYESIRDPYHYGSKAKGIGLRAAIALSTIADALIVYSAVTALFHTSTANENGEPEVLRWTVEDILQAGGGKAGIIAAGVIISITAIVQLVYGISSGYRERLDIDHLPRWLRNVVHCLAWAGYGARGIILGITGFFFIKAGITENAYHVVNTDKAFEFIAEQAGAICFYLAAAGTIAYGLFMFVFGVYYDTDRD
jgi:hypothetical protein